MSVGPTSRLHTRQTRIQRLTARALYDRSETSNVEGRLAFWVRNCNIFEFHVRNVQTYVSLQI